MDAQSVPVWDLPSLMRMLALMTFEGPITPDENVWWNIDHKSGDLIFEANANDCFAWACADGEVIRPEDLDALEKACADVVAIDEFSSWGTLLWVCRKRQCRLMDCSYPVNKALWPLFDAAGPDRSSEQHNVGPRPSPCRLASCMSGRRGEPRLDGYCCELHQRMAK